ncbi:MAG: hypothetical protein GX102_02120 [Porphyromonadaceae bacterium]|nr:hypothetical protein [Porphyromonadaceae bacterium]
MKKTLILSLALTLLFSCNTKTEKEQAQIDSNDCNCLENYHWMKETFEKNDAGFEWIIQKKGEEAYQKFCDSIENEIKEANDIYRCEEILNDWGKFFRKGHFFVASNLPASKVANPDSVEKVNYTIQTIEVQSKQTDDRMIGVWESSPYKIGIVLDTLNPTRKYVGFIIESGVSEWTKGDVKLEIFEQDNKLSSNYYMQDRSIEKRDVHLIGGYELMIGSMNFINTSKIDNEIEKKLLDETKPLFYNFSAQTAILKIPSFNSDQKSKIDELIEQNREQILSHKNLIIDLRNNGGGSDKSWKELIPFIYTNPIKNIGVELLSSELNREKFLGNFTFIQKLLLRKSIKRWESNDGKFVVVTDSVFINKMDDVLPNPENVIVVVDEICASSVEQFLLSAKQSKKVKIYGKLTFGALDVSNVASVTSPDRCFKLGYCLTRTLRPEKDRIDNIGIKPDVEINDSIPKHKWIEFVLNEIEK